jgi:hypothetical protein
MVVAVILIVLIKLYSRWIASRSHHIQDKISKKLEPILFHAESLKELQLEPNLRSFKDIVEVLERFDQRISDLIWLEIKAKIIDTYLIPVIDKQVKSYDWVKRQYAARCYLLLPCRAPENHLETLLHDRKYLVRVVAAVCIIQTKHKELFFHVIQQMSKETVLSRFSYRDALIKADPEKFLWLEEILKKESDPAIDAICLDILSTRLTRDILPLIRSFVNKNDRACRLLAIKALGNIPSKESVDLLEEHLLDSDWEVRAEAIKGLSKLYATHVIPKLKQLLSDPIWWVRLQAALALKQFGKEGQQILSSQDSTSADAYEISRYVLGLPSGIVAI